MNLVLKKKFVKSIVRYIMGSLYQGLTVILKIKKKIFYKKNFIFSFYFFFDYLLHLIFFFFDYYYYYFSHAQRFLETNYYA